MVFSQILKSCKKEAQQKLEMLIKNWQNNLVLKVKKFQFIKKTILNWKNKIIFPLKCLALKIKHNTIYSSKKTFEKHVDLFLSSNYKNSIMF